MTSREAKQILLSYRPGTRDHEDPQIAQALKTAETDPELAVWLENHLVFQQAMRTKFRQTEVPPRAPRILFPAHQILYPQPWWRSPAWLAAAAAVILLACLSSFWLKTPKADGFANLQERMVSTALREYRMDLETNNMVSLREFLSAHGAPADYDLTKGLEKLQLTGGGLLRWRSNPVSMVCFNRGDNQMIFLFVVDRSVLNDPPPSVPKVSRMHELVTASWSRGDKAYILAGPEEKDFAAKYL